MISENELNILFEKVARTRNPSNLFEISSLQVYSRGFRVKLGTRKIYVDFPRIVYFIQQIILGICSNKIPQIPTKTVEDLFDKIEETERAVNEINYEKEDSNTDLGFLTEKLEKLGIKWSCIFRSWYKKPVLRFYTDRYFKDLWVVKLKQFIRELNSGDDSPVKIYEKARTLTPEYKKAQRDTHAKPKIFEIFLNSELSPYKELERLWNISQRLMRIVYSYKSPILFREIDRIFMDMKTIIHQIRMMLESGYCFSGYVLLRKFLTDFAYIIFYDSITNWLLKHGIRDEIIVKEGYGKEVISTYVSEFPHKWVSIHSYGELIAYEDLEKRDKDTKLLFKIPDLDTFANAYKKWGKNQILNRLTTSYVYPRDKFLTELLDVIVTYSIDIFEFIENDYQLKNNDKIVSKEYSKLSEVIHEPIYIDFPPFSSLIEYLGFLHHLRKVRYFLNLVVKNYKKARTLTLRKE